MRPARSALSKIDSRSPRKARPTVSPGRAGMLGRQPRLHRPVLGGDGDDLRGAEIFGAEHRAAKRATHRRSGCARAGRRARARSRPCPRASSGTAIVGAVDPQRSRALARRPARNGQEVHRRRADEVGDEHRRRPVVDLLRRGELLDHAAVHHRDLVGHRHRLELVVGDVDGGRLDAVVQLAQLAHHQVAELGVERAERLVHQERLRPAHDGAAERDALAVAAGEAARPAGRGDGRCAGAAPSPRRAA